MITRRVINILIIVNDTRRSSCHVVVLRKYGYRNLIGPEVPKMFSDLIIVSTMY